jgi:hypothetical protein
VPHTQPGCSIMWSPGEACYKRSGQRVRGCCTPSHACVKDGASPTGHSCQPVQQPQQLEYTYEQAATAGGCSMRVGVGGQCGGTGGSCQRCVCASQGLATQCRAPRSTPQHVPDVLPPTRAPVALHLHCRYSTCSQLGQWLGFCCPNGFSCTPSATGPQRFRLWTCQLNVQDRPPLLDAAAEVLAYPPRPMPPRACTCRHTFNSTRVPMDCPSPWSSRAGTSLVSLTGAPCQQLPGESEGAPDQLRGGVKPC